jgi:uncharacterized membrane protein YhaH (DUF805 family)
VTPPVQRLLLASGLLGRSTRTALLRLLVPWALAIVALFVLHLELVHGRVRSEAGMGAVRLLAALLPWIEAAASLALLWLSIRRFHDQDRPGWLGLLNWSFLVAVALLTAAPPARKLLILALVMIPLFLPGTVGPNRHGPDPRGWKSREHYEEERRLGRAR